MAQPTAADVEQLLQQILIPNTQTTNTAGQHLMEYLKNPVSAQVMFQIMQGSQDPQVRQGAALLLRRKIAKHWSKVPGQIKEAMKNGLLEMLVGEPERIVRYSVASMVSTVARLTIPSNQWPNLMDYIAQIASSASSDHREMAYVTLFEIEEHIGDVLERFYPQFYDLFKRGMSPQEDPRVQSAAMKCIGMILDWCKEDEQAHARFRDLIPMIVDIITLSIHQNRVDDAITGFSTLQEFIETPFSVVEPYFEALMKFVLEIGANSNLEFNLRYEALTVVQWVASFKSGLILRHNMLPSILTVAFEMCSEEDDDIEDDDNLTPHKYGSQVIDSMARHVQTVSVYPVLQEFVVKYFSSGNPFYRRAALGALIGMADGCCELMAPDLSEWIKIIIAGMQDPHPLVRQVACLALSQFSEWLSPEIYEYYEQLMPHMHNALHEDNAEMQQKACCAIIAFIENIETQHSLPFVDKLMTRLVMLLQQSGNKQVQEMCICAISAIASSTGKSFMQYWAPTTQLMAQCMDIINPEMIVLRSRALECAGLIALAVGKETFAPHVNYFMQKAIEGYQMDSAGGDLREYAMTFLGNMAEALGPDFTPFLDVAMQCVQQSLMSTDGIIEDVNLPAALQAFGEEEYEEPEDEQGEDGEVVDEGTLDDLGYSVQRSYVEEKIQALHALGVVALSSGPSFLPYIEKCMPLLNFAISYVHHDVRKASAFPIENMMICIHKAFPPQREWVPGNNPEEYSISQQTQSFVDTVMPMVITKIQADIDPETVSRWMDTVKTMIESLGLPSVHKYMSTITGVVANILQGRHECLEEDFEGENENASVETEHLELFCSCCDLIVTMGKQYGNYFAAWLDLLDYIIHFANDKRDGWRQESFGCLSEVAAAAQATIGPKVGPLMQLAAKGIHDSHLPTRSNAAYLLGLLCETGGVSQYFSQIVGDLVGLLDKETDTQLLDNICGCISRMIFVAPNAFDVGAVIPPLFGKLPLRYDMEEWPPVLHSIFALFSMQHPAVAPQIPQVIAVLTYLLQQADNQPSPWEKIPPELKDQSISLVKHLGQAYAEQLQPIISQLPPAQQEMYSKCVNS